MLSCTIISLITFPLVCLHFCPYEFPERTVALGATASRVFSRWDGIDVNKSKGGSKLFFDGRLIGQSCKPVLTKDRKSLRADTK